MPCPIMPTLKPVIKVEPTKPSQKKGFLIGFMLGWEWEKATEALSKFFSRRKK